MAVLTHSVAPRRVLPKRLPQARTLKRAVERSTACWCGWKVGRRIRADKVMVEDSLNPYPFSHQNGRRGKGENVGMVGRTGKPHQGVGKGEQESLTPGPSPADGRGEVGRTKSL